MTLNEVAAATHENAVKHGWWDTPPSFPEIIALCHSELSEALQEYREGRPALWYRCLTSEGTTPCMREGCGDWQDGKCELACLAPKPEGMAVEMADALLRILDWLASEELDAEAIIKAKLEYNTTRSFKHGGKVI